MVLHVAGVNIGEISVRCQASKVKIDSNCLMVPFAIRWG
jgi:hypothetical protein